MAIESQKDISQFSIPPQERAISVDGSFNDFTYIIPISSSEISQDLNLPKTVSLSLLDQSLNGEYYLNPSFHITALGFPTQQLISDKIQEAHNQGNDLGSQINLLLSSIDFSFEIDSSKISLIKNIDYSPDLVKEGASFESEATIAIEVENSGIKKFYQGLKELGILIPPPSAHITLYLKDNQSATGLGIALWDLKNQKQGISKPSITLIELNAGFSLD